MYARWTAAARAQGPDLERMDSLDVQPGAGAMTSRQSDVPRFRRLLAALLYLGLVGRPPDSKDGIGADFGCTASRGTQLVDDGLKLLRGEWGYRRR